MSVSESGQLMPVSYPETYEVIPLDKPPARSVRVPGSKSITNRALVLAALASRQGGCRLEGALRSEDTEVMVAALQQLGFRVQPESSSDRLIVDLNTGAVIPANSAELFVANSGTTMRFLAAMLALGHGRYRLDGVARMRERPIEDLLVALRQLGVKADSEAGTGCPPVLIDAQGLAGGRVAMRGDTSSQFLSALLMAAPFAEAAIEVTVAGPVVSEPYVAMTLHLMRAWSLHVETAPGPIYRVRPQKPKQPTRYLIEGDASAASYFFGAAALTGGSVTVNGSIPERESIQGDTAFLKLLERMGCRVESNRAGNVVHGGPLRGIDVDMNAVSDTVMTIAAVACFAEGPTTIRNVAHIRHKETDRLSALATELRRVGAEVAEFADGLTITPRPLHGAEIKTYNDHRMAMSMALLGLRVPGIVIQNPGCVAKTYPRFFEELEKLR
jgi:3-phosphoshikimate 1-carboxyvinyltransferase